MLWHVVSVPNSHPSPLRRWLSAAIACTAVAALSSAAQAQPSGDTGPPPRLNEIQAMATHNSYHREVSFAEQKVMERHAPTFRNLLYSHASLLKQLERERVRGIELDGEGGGPQTGAEGRRRESGPGRPPGWTRWTGRSVR
ncbi:Ca2+-dependent phosphoinositide-specific phospholipase C [Streptomyces oceani]|uniref:Ca2+-dependent phosphoinositide-specific phospholipase C n=1 Tax=Streptomyces oceani TaxID=1075402 RepID=UPI0009A0EC49|nr:Ca2+-dependent phosphoinositide-specific phospholipase C [Streptomyces oceani]